MTSKKPDYYTLLHAFLKRNPMTRDQLAERIGVSAPTLDTWLAHDAAKRKQPNRLSARAIRKYVNQIEGIRGA